MTMIQNRREFIKLMGISGITLPILGLNFPENKNENNPLQKSSTRSINVFSKVLEWLDYKKMAEKSSQIGFDGIDLTVRAKGHVLPENADKDLPNAINIFRKEGLKTPIITTQILDADDPKTKKILKSANEVGIDYYRMGWYKYDENLSIKKNLEKIRRKFNKLTELNVKYNIQGIYQIHSNFLYPKGQLFGCYIWDLYHILKDIDNRWIGVQYDICHATTEAGLSWPLGMELLSPFIKSVVYKDFIWEKRNKVWKKEIVPLGEGMVDWKNYFAMEHQLGVHTPITIHFEYPLGGAEKGKEKIGTEPKKIYNALQKDLSFVKHHLNNKKNS
jgi:sugar phosphate isomerase/epimerase